MSKKLYECMPSDWYEKLVKLESFNLEEFQNFFDELQQDYQKETIYPSFNDIFKAFYHTSYTQMKVVIFGQDPYHDGSADGLAFSNSSTKKLSPSLRNLFKELEFEYHQKRIDGNLEDWAKQGVLLLNAVLTVKKGQPNSYKNSKWVDFIDAIVKICDQKEEPVVFVLFGNSAIKYEKLISDKNYILKFTHPSPLSAYRGFFNCNCFKKINDALRISNQKEIDFI